MCVILYNFGPFFCLNLMKMLTPPKEGLPNMIDKALRMRREEQARQVMVAWAILKMSLAGMIYTEM